MEIFELIKQENQKIMNNLRKLEDTSAHQPEERQILLQEVQQRIARLKQVEEEHLYPLLQGDTRTQRGAEISRQEGRGILDLLSEMDEVPVTDTGFKYLIERLHGEYQIHAQWEEEELFRKAQEVIDPEQAGLLGERARNQLH